MLYWTGLAVGSLSLLAFLFMAEADKKLLPWLFWLTAVIGMYCYGLGSQDIGQKGVYRNLAREVDFQQIPVSGQKDFVVIAQITYVDGKMDQVTIVHNTTKALPTNNESRK
ncbi:MAG: hypothetical protein WC848_04165 [Parcubacteria group bacterium]